MNVWFNLECSDVELYNFLIVFDVIILSSAKSLIFQFVGCNDITQPKDFSSINFSFLYIHQTTTWQTTTWQANRLISTQNIFIVWVYKLEQNYL